MNNYLLIRSANILKSLNRPGAGLKTLWVLLVVFYFGNAQAAVECYFSNAPFTTTLSLNGPEISLHPPVSSTTMLTDKNQKATSTWAIHSACRVGNDGEDLFGKKGSIAQIESYNTGLLTPAALYATNIPGVLYSIEIRDSHVDAFTPYTSSTGEIKVFDMNDKESLVDDKSWNFYIALYQTSQYVGIPQGVSEIHPLSQGNVGAFRLGKNDSNNGLITVNIGDFSFPVKTPTCTSLVSSAGAGTIPLGDYTALQVKSGSTKTVNFTLNASGCTNVSMFNSRVTTNIVAPGNDMLLGNSATSNAATGVGVKIMAEHTQLKPNDINSIRSVIDYNLPASKQLQFSAQLVADSKAISVGKFTAKGTFVVNYE